MFEKEKKPVTILTGYLGSGKTTVLNELLKYRGSEKIAVIVNDMGSINIDASLIKNQQYMRIMWTWWNCQMGVSVVHCRMYL